MKATRAGFIWRAGVGLFCVLALLATARGQYTDPPDESGQIPGPPSDVAAVLTTNIAARVPKPTNTWSDGYVLSTTNNGTSTYATAAGGVGAQFVAFTAAYASASSTTNAAPLNSWAAFTAAYASASSTTNAASLNAYVAFTAAYASASSTTNAAPLNSWAAFTAAYASASSTTNAAPLNVYAAFTAAYAAAGVTTGTVFTGDVAGAWNDLRLQPGTVGTQELDAALSNRLFQSVLDTNTVFTGDATGLWNNLQIGASTIMVNHIAAFTGTATRIGVEGSMSIVLPPTNSATALNAQGSFLQLGSGTTNAAAGLVAWSKNGNALTGVSSHFIWNGDGQQAPSTGYWSGVSNLNTTLNSGDLRYVRNDSGTITGNGSQVSLRISNPQASQFALIIDGSSETAFTATNYFGFYLRSRQSLYWRTCNSAAPYIDFVDGGVDFRGLFISNVVLRGNGAAVSNVVATDSYKLGGLASSAYVQLDNLTNYPALVSWGYTFTNPPNGNYLSASGVYTAVGTKGATGWVFYTGAFVHP